MIDLETLRKKCATVSIPEDRMDTIPTLTNNPAIITIEDILPEDLFRQAVFKVYNPLCLRRRNCSVTETEIPAGYPRVKKVEEFFGFNEKEWEKTVGPELSRPLFSDTEGRELRRKMCMEATVINLDSQGRLVIPDKMMEYAEIKENLIVIGAGDHFEIWDSRVWNEYSKTIETNKK